MKCNTSPPQGVHVPCSQRGGGRQALDGAVMPESTKHRSAPKEKWPWCLSLGGPLGDTPSIRSDIFLGPYKDPWGTNAKVASAPTRAMLTGWGRQAGPRRRRYARATNPLLFRKGNLSPEGEEIPYSEGRSLILKQGERF